MSRSYIIELFDGNNFTGSSFIAINEYKTKHEAEEYAEKLKNIKDYWMSVKVRRVGFFEQISRKIEKKIKMQDDYLRQ